MSSVFVKKENKKISAQHTARHQELQRDLNHAPKGVFALSSWAEEESQVCCIWWFEDFKMPSARQVQNILFFIRNF